MTALGKFEEIVSWYANTLIDETREILPQTKPEQLTILATALAEKLPPHIIELYERYDGESRSGAGSFLGHEFMSVAEIIHQVNEAIAAIKPSNPAVPNPTKADQYAEDLATVVKDAAKRIFEENGIPPDARGWHEIRFKCSPGSISGPYLYETTGNDRTILRLTTEEFERVHSIATEFSKLEHVAYGWDELSFRVNANSGPTFERLFYDFDNNLPLTSHPVGAIKKRYFGEKWLPVIHDGGNNFIGIDLDPGPNGIKGQVIVYGRDEDDRFVVAKSWEAFLDLAIATAPKNIEGLRQGAHIHDMFKKNLGIC